MFGEYEYNSTACCAFQYRIVDAHFILQSFNLDGQDKNHPNLLCKLKNV